MFFFFFFFFFSRLRSTVYSTVSSPHAFVPYTLETRRISCCGEAESREDEVRGLLSLRLGNTTAESLQTQQRGSQLSSPHAVGNDNSLP